MPFPTVKLFSHTPKIPAADPPFTSTGQKRIPRTQTQTHTHRQEGAPVAPECEKDGSPREEVAFSRGGFLGAAARAPCRGSSTKPRTREPTSESPSRATPQVGGPRPSPRPRATTTPLGSSRSPRPTLTARRGARRPPSPASESPHSPRPSPSRPSRPRGAGGANRGRRSLLRPPGDAPSYGPDPPEGPTTLAGAAARLISDLG